MSKLAPLHCSKCGAPIFSKKEDIVFICENCGNEMIFDNGKLNDTEFKIAKFQKEYQGDKVYLPFWVIDSNINILSETNLGGGIMKIFKGDDYMTGRWKIFVCAADFPPAEAKRWNQTFTMHPPEFNEERGFGGINRFPVSIGAEDADKNAEFLFLAHELEKAGTLQDIQYDFKILGREIVYIPYFYYQGQYYVGLQGEWK